MHICLGCNRQFDKAGSLNSHKRFCSAWNSVKHLHQNQTTDLNTRKNQPVSCPNCNKEFRNIYAMSAHKGHCTGHSSTNQLKGKRAWNKRKLILNPDEIFRVFKKGESKSNNKTYKRYLLAEGVEEVCSCCGISEWQGSRIVLELDHINGQNLDNRRENLRLLCPNCHSQTPTWKRRKK